MTYNINAMNINVRHEKNDNLVLNQHTIPYIHMARTVLIFIIALHSILHKNGVLDTCDTHVVIAKV